MNYPATTTCLVMMLCAPCAQAQSSYSVFGILDVAVRRAQNEGSSEVSSLVSGSGATSRLGVQGAEALEAGWNASFHLEQGINVDTGTQANAKFWDRRSTVSLSNKSWGELRLGRDFVPTYRSWSRYDPFAYVGAGRSADFFTNSPNGPIRAAFGSNENTTVRADNGIQVLLPNLAGLEGELMYTPGEGGSVAAGQARMRGIRLGYVAAAYEFSAAVAHSKNSQTTDGDFSDTTLGGSFKLDELQLAAAWRKLDYSTAQQKNALLSAIYTSGMHQIKLSRNQVDMAGRVGTTRLDANGATKTALGWVGNLSRRTALYATVAQIHNRGAAAFSIPGGSAAPTGGHGSRGYELGMTSKF